MKKKRGFYIDPLWLAFLLVGVAVGLMLSALRPVEAVEIVKDVPVEVIKEVPVVRTITKTVYVEEPQEPESIGTFKVTAYCPCEKCCGKWADGITATGTRATEGRTIAVDPKVIPYGTEVTIRYEDGTEHTYTAEDCGGAIKGNRIDVYMESHEAALVAGVKYGEVFING